MNRVGSFRGALVNRLPPIHQIEHFLTLKMLHRSQCLMTSQVETVICRLQNVSSTAPIIFAPILQIVLIENAGLLNAHGEFLLRLQGCCCSSQRNLVFFFLHLQKLIVCFFSLLMALLLRCGHIADQVWIFKRV